MAEKSRFHEDEVNGPKPVDQSADEWLHGKWFLMYKEMDGGIDASNLDLISDLKYVNAPPMQFYADPFAVKQGDLYHVFLESYDYKKGTLSSFVINESMEHGQLTPVDIGVNVHLSFPHVFDINGDFYMIPESCHLNQINLYRCVNFPNKWIHTKTLIPNVHSGDNQLLFRDNKWWMFSMVYHNGTNHFCIYYADDLLGEWRQHKIANINNTRPNNDITRGAGKIFTDKCGRLIRPAQYSNKSINGEGVILYEIKELTADTYVEEPVNIILPSLIYDDIRAIHTFSVCDNLILMDGRKVRSTDPLFTSGSVESEIALINSINNKK